MSQQQQLRVALRAEALAEVQDDPKKLEAVIECATSFRGFLNHWYFRDQERAQVKILGRNLWPAQEWAIREMTEVELLYLLKARKLGETTLACAYDAWVLRFRGANERVHLFSRRDDAARELLDAVKFGLNKLPEYMKLHSTKWTTTEIQLQAEEDDIRIAKAYPADEDTAVEATCTHGHVDEWARMGNPERVWQAIEPSMARSCHLITTGLGPTNYTASFWRKSQEGRTPFKPVFIPALERPGRDKDWLRKKRESMNEEQFRREYAMTWQDALYGGGDFIFKESDLDRAQIDAWGLRGPQEGRRYVKAWDIGRHKDAAVGTVLDVTDDVMQVVGRRRVKNLPYPQLQFEIERMHGIWPGMTWIEKNAAGEAVMENLEIPEKEVGGHDTTPRSKPRMIANLQADFEHGRMKYSKEHWPDLDQELRSYQLPDTHVVQDSVISLAIARDKAHTQPKKGRLGKPWKWG